MAKGEKKKSVGSARLWNRIDSPISPSPPHSPTAPDITPYLHPVPRYKYLVLSSLSSFEVDVTNAVSLMWPATCYIYILAWPPIYGFVIEKEFPATLFSASPTRERGGQRRTCRRALWQLQRPAAAAAAAAAAPEFVLLFPFARWIHLRWFQSVANGVPV